MAGRKNYTYIVGDSTGAETDPMSFEETLKFVKDGQITGATFVKRSDQDHWGTAADYPELQTKDMALSPLEMASGGSSSTDKVDPLAAEMEQAAFAKPIRNGGNWFFWVAALSLINTIAVAMESDWGFALGLQLIYIVGEGAGMMGEHGRWYALAINLLLAGGFFWSGAAGYSRKYLPYFLGLSLYAGDCFLSLLTLNIFAIGLHFVALYYMGKGLLAFLQAEDRKLLPALLKGLPISVAVGVGGMVLAGVIFHNQSVPELDALVDGVLEPEVYVNNAEFEGYPPLTNGFSLLVKLPSGKVVALAETISLMGLEKDGQKLMPTDVKNTLKKWTIELDYDRATKLEIEGPLTDEITTGIDAGGGIMALTLKTEPDFDKLEDPIEIRTRGPVEGEEIYLLTPALEDGNYTFSYHKGVFGPLQLNGFVGIQFEVWTDTKGFEGAIALDKEGKLVGIVPKTRLEKKAKARGTIAMSVEHLKEL